MNWVLDNRSEKCVLCGKEFSVGGNYRSALEPEKLDNESLKNHKGRETRKNLSAFEESASRAEFCLECFEKEVRSFSPSCHWKGRISDPVEEKAPLDARNLPLDKDQLLQLFIECLKKEQNAENPEDKNENRVLSYLLALMLERKRTLVQRETLPGDPFPFSVYENPKSKEIFQVAIPSFVSDELPHWETKILNLLAQ